MSSSSSAATAAAVSTTLDIIALGKRLGELDAKAKSAWANVAGKKGEEYTAATQRHSGIKARRDKVEALFKQAGGNRALTSALRAAAAAQNAADQSDDGGDEHLDRARQHLRNNYVFSIRRNLFWCRAGGDWISRQGLDGATGFRMPFGERGRHVPADVVFSEDRQAPRVFDDRYFPGDEDEIVDVDGHRWLNTWQAPTLVPAEGDAAPMIDLILYLCNGISEHADHLLDWLAFCYQNPGKKIGHAPLIISEHHGVGKDTVFTAVKRLFGDSNCVEVNDEMLASQYNAWTNRTQMAVIPEIMCGDRADIANKMKPLITQTTIQLREMRCDTRSILNQLNIMMFSNWLNAAMIEDHDRRYFVIICRAAPRETAYYDAIYDYIRGDGLAGFAWFLKERDLSRFNPSAPPPKTADKDIVRNATRSGLEAWLDDAIESHAAPFDRDVVNLREAVDEINKGRNLRATVQNVGAFLRKHGGADLDKIRLGSGGRMRLWAVRAGAWYKDRPGKAAEAYLGAWHYSDDTAGADGPAEVIIPSAFKVARAQQDFAARSAHLDEAAQAWLDDAEAEARAAAEREQAS